MNRKQSHHEAIRERAQAAIRNLYHNATIVYPRDDFGRSEDYFQSWLQCLCEFELDYIKSGGAYGADYRKTLEHPANAGRFKSEAARRYYVRMKMKAMREERERCNSLDSRTAPVNCLWECIGEFGKLYQWGRGGRTLAPDSMIREGGGSSFSIREDYCDSLPIAECVRVLRIVESFNRYVEGFCASIPEQWGEHCAQEDAAKDAAERERRARKAKETRERNYWAARDVATV